MAVSDKERVWTFLIGAVMGCLVVGGLIQRRNSHREARENIADAPVPEWAHPLPGVVPEVLRKGKILHFQALEDGRIWILQYEKNYPFVQVGETYAAQSSTGAVSTFQFLAADRMIVRLRPGVTVKEFQDVLIPMGLHTRENFKKKGLVIAGMPEVGIGKLEEALAKIRRLEMVETAEYDAIRSGGR